MKSECITFGMFLIVLVLLGALSYPTGQAAALPEYSTQVGEPCATCHISPSGGGARTPRGQAWVGSSKPGAVPDLLRALEVLGVRLDVNQSDFVAVRGDIPEPQPLPPSHTRPSGVYLWLRNYDGN